MKCSLFYDIMQFFFFFFVLFYPCVLHMKSGCTLGLKFQFFSTPFFCSQIAWNRFILIACIPLIFFSLSLTLALTWIDVMKISSTLKRFYIGFIAAQSDIIYYKSVIKSYTRWHITPLITSISPFYHPMNLNKAWWRKWHHCNSDVWRR